MADTSAGIQAAADRIRETAKWLTISLATLGGVLIAGSQLSDIGNLQPSSSRFAAWRSSAVASPLPRPSPFSRSPSGLRSPPRSVLKQLAAKPPAGLGDTLEDPQFLGGRSTVKQLDAEYTAALNARNTAFATLGQEDSQANRATAEAADLPSLFSLSDTVTSLIADVAGTCVSLVPMESSVPVAALLACGVVAAAGIGAFTWAANPPAEVKASMATPSVLTTPETITVTLTAQGQMALRNGAPSGPSVH